MTTTRCDPAASTAHATRPTPALPAPALPAGVPPLRSYYLYLSNSCNLACRHCWITPRFVDGVPDAGDVIAVEALHDAVREGKTLGLQAAKLTGGEPMLHPDFLDIVRMLSGEALSLSMETNGTLLTADSAHYLKQESNVHFISISIDGATPQSHDSFRNVPGAFAAAVRGLDHLVAAGYHNVQVIMAPHRGNAHEVEAVVQLAVAHGAGSVKFNPITNSGRGQAMHARGEAFDFDEHLAFARYVRTTLQAQTPIPVMTMTAPALMSMQELWLTGGDTGDCGVRNILGILGTGELALCGIGRTIPALVYGRLGQDSIRDIWLRHPVINDLRRQLADYRHFPGICGECVHAKTCLTGCVANNYVDSGSLIAPQPLCAEAARRGVFPASRRHARASDNIS